MVDTQGKDKVLDNKDLKKAMRKVWWKIIPVVFIFYVIAFLDRVNIGFAISSIESQLSLSAAVLGLAAGIFFIGYFIFEVPGTYYVEKIGAKKIITIFLIGWGIFAALTGISSDALELYFFRFMTGLMEGAFFPGIIYYISLWFPTRSRATAMALFLTAIPISIIIGAPVASAIIVTKFLGWRYLFYIEGLLAIVAGVFAPFIMTNRPQDAKWLTKNEKNALISKLEEEKRKATKFAKQTVLAALTNVRTILLVLIYFFLSIGIYAIAIWTPDIIQLASSSGIVHTGYLVAFLWIVILVSMVVNGWHSDKTGERLIHVIVPFSLGIIGSLIAMIFIHNFVILYLGLIIIGIGTQAGVAVFWSFPTRYLTVGAAAAAIGLINAFGGLGGFVGPYAIGDIKTATGSFYLAYSLVLVSFVLAIIFMLILNNMDKKENAANKNKKAK